MLSVKKVELLWKIYWSPQDCSTRVFLKNAHHRFLHSVSAKQKTKQNKTKLHCWPGHRRYGKKSVIVIKNNYIAVVHNTPRFNGSMWSSITYLLSYFILHVCFTKRLPHSMSSHCNRATGTTHGRRSGAIAAVNRT